MAAASANTIKDALQQLKESFSLWNANKILMNVNTTLTQADVVMLIALRSKSLNPDLYRNYLIKSSRFGDINKTQTMISHAIRSGYHTTKHNESWNSYLVDAYINQQDNNNALTILQQIHTNNSTATPPTYSRMIMQFGKDNIRECNVVISLAKKQQKDIEKFIEVAMKVFASTQDVRICEGLLYSLKNEGRSISSDTFQTLFNTFGKKLPKSATKWLGLMREMKMIPTRAIYASIGVEESVEKSPLTTLELIAEMNKDGIPLTDDHYLAWISALKVLKNVEDAEKMVENMERKGIMPNHRIYSQLIRIYSSANMIEKAEEVYKKISFPGVPLRDNMIRVYFTSKNYEKAVDIFHSCKRDGLKPTNLTYNIMIATAGNLKGLEEAKKWEEEMRKDGLTPDAVTIDTLKNVRKKEEDKKEEGAKEREKSESKRGS